MPDDARNSRPSPITGMHIGGAIAKALGLPPLTNLIQIRIGLDEAVEVICRYYPTQEAMDNLYHVFKSYHVVPVYGDGAWTEPEATAHPPIQHRAEER